MHELNHMNGKGDKERSPGWRDHYEEINFGAGASGFVRVNASRIRKTYPVGNAPKLAPAIIEVQNFPVPGCCGAAGQCGCEFEPNSEPPPASSSYRRMRQQRIR